MTRLIAVLMFLPFAIAAAPVPKADAVEPASLKIRKALDDSGDVTLENQSLNDTVTFFKNRLKIDIKVDATATMLMLDAAGPPFSVKAHGKTYRKILKDTLEPQHLTFAIVGGSLLIGSEESVLAKQLRQSVSLDASGTSLSALLKTLSDDSGANIVIDPRQIAAADAGKVTLKLDDVPLETAVRLVTEVGGLRTIRMNNVFFITNDVRADKLRADADGPIPPASNMNGMFGGVERGVFGGVGGAIPPQAIPALPLVPAAPAAPAPAAPPPAPK